MDLVNWNVSINLTVLKNDLKLPSSCKLAACYLAWLNRQSKSDQ